MTNDVTVPNTHVFKRSAISLVINSCILLSAASLMFGFASDSHANTGPSASSPETDTQVVKYTPDFFMGFSPQTLYDILEKTPGANSLIMSMNNAAQSRGFGSGGDQILINNKRMSGKENSIQNELVNIQAQDVDYIELIRGTRSDLDVQSDGLVINVVLKKDVKSSVLWSVGGATAPNVSVKPEFSIIYNAGLGDFKYRLGVSRNVNPTHFSNTETYTSSEQVHTDTYKRVRHHWFIQDRLSGKFEYSLSDKTDLQMNGLYEKLTIDSDFTTNHENVLTNEQDKNVIIYDNDRDKWELSGDISHVFNTKNNFKLLFISNSLDADDHLARFSLLDEQVPTPQYQLPRVYTVTENVLRGNWKYQLSPRHSFDSGLEVAINNRKEDLQFISQSNAPYHSTELNDVKETRYEAFVHYNFAISPKLNIQSSLMHERSTMDVATDYSLVRDTTDEVKKGSSRTFSYFKPRVNIRYDVNDIYQMRFNYERTVSQLRLNDFVPWFNRDETRLEETNPDLKPEMRDEISLSVEKQWLDADGSLTLTPYYHKISDLITEIPLEKYSGSGNVDSAKEYGLTLDTNFSLKNMGMENTLISLGYTWRHSEMTHPFSGKNAPLERRSNNDWNIQINQSELLPGLSLNATIKSQSPYQFSSYDYQGTMDRGATTELSLDYKINDSLKLRFMGEHLFNRKLVLHRERYSGPFGQENLLRNEHRDGQVSRRLSLTLTGQF